MWGYFWISSVNCRKGDQIDQLPVNHRSHISNLAEGLNQEIIILVLIEKREKKNYNPMRLRKMHWLTGNRSILIFTVKIDSKCHLFDFKYRKGPRFAWSGSNTWLLVWLHGYCISVSIRYHPGAFWNRNAYKKTCLYWSYRNQAELPTR